MPATSYRYLTNRPGVRSGRMIVEGTRIGVHDVVGLLQNGETLDTLIARCFPELTRAQVYECLSYYEDHRIEIDAMVAEQMAEGPARVQAEASHVLALLRSAGEQGLANNINFA